jgi:hypothetical protein
MNQENVVCPLLLNKASRAASPRRSGRRVGFVFRENVSDPFIVSPL